jgi:predicted dehydrogenase
MAHFAECILTDTPIKQGTSEDALRVMEIIDKVYQVPPVHAKKSGL